MPATMMHLLAGSRLLADPSDAFLLGTILPDCLDSDREKKDHLHLRDIPQEERLSALIRLGHTLSLERDFDLGALFHLYLDYLWDNGPQAAHRRSYEGETWFLDYRKELKKAGSRAYLYMKDAKETWLRLREAEPSLYQSVLNLPQAEIEAFLQFNCEFHISTRLEESEIFTDEVVLRFTDRSLRAFRNFLEDFFPRVARETSFA